MRSQVHRELHQVLLSGHCACVPACPYTLSEVTGSRANLASLHHSDISVYVSAYAHIRVRILVWQSFFAWGMSGTSSFLIKRHLFFLQQLCPALRRPHILQIAHLHLGVPRCILVFFSLFPPEREARLLSFAGTTTFFSTAARGMHIYDIYVCYMRYR